MPRHMSFAMTIPQFKAQTKDVTRRFGWWFLQPGDIVEGVTKSMGLKKGEKVVSLGLIEIVSCRTEPLQVISPEELIREGFPNTSREDFIKMMVDAYQVSPLKMCNRIEYKYL